MIKGVRISKLILTFLAIASIVSCNKNSCTDDYILNQLQFYKSEIDDLENIKIECYEKNSNFEVSVETDYYIIKTELVDDVSSYFRVKLNKNINTDFDYKFKLINGKECLISDIRVKEQICYDGLVSKEYSKSFDGYLMNGDNFSCQIIKIFPH